MTSSDYEFAVVDVETTGFGKNDRVIEFAAIRMGSDGRPLDEYVTLVNPSRDVGPTRTHGIRARDVQHAPKFDEIAGDVTSILAGAVFVAHNASFDMRMLRQEFGRLHHDLPPFPFLWTPLSGGSPWVLSVSDSRFVFPKHIPPKLTLVPRVKF